MQVLLFCNLECILIVFLNIKNYEMILDHSPKEISLFFRIFQQYSALCGAVVEGDVGVCLTGSPYL